MSFIGRNSILSNSGTIVSRDVERDSRLSIASRSLDIGWNIRNKSRNHSITRRGNSTCTNDIHCRDSEGVAGTIGETSNSGSEIGRRTIIKRCP